MPSLVLEFTPDGVVASSDFDLFATDIETRTRLFQVVDAIRPLCALESAESVEPLALPSPETDPVIEYSDGGYVQWAGVASRLESGEITEFRCFKKSSSAGQTKSTLVQKYPLLACEILPDGERSELVVKLWSNR